MIPGRLCPAHTPFITLSKVVTPYQTLQFILRFCRDVRSSVSSASRGFGIDLVIFGLRESQQGVMMLLRFGLSMSDSLPFVVVW